MEWNLGQSLYTVYSNQSHAKVTQQISIWSSEDALTSIQQLVLKLQTSCAKPSLELASYVSRQIADDVLEENVWQRRVTFPRPALRLQV